MCVHSGIIWHRKKNTLKGTIIGGGRRVGKTTPKRGQGWSSPTPRGLRRTGKEGGSCHQWCPDDPYGLRESEKDSLE